MQVKIKITKETFSLVLGKTSITSQNDLVNDGNIEENIKAFFLGFEEVKALTVEQLNAIVSFIGFNIKSGLEDFLETIIVGGADHQGGE